MKVEIAENYGEAAIICWAGPDEIRFAHRQPIIDEEGKRLDEFDVLSELLSTASAAVAAGKPKPPTITALNPATLTVPGADAELTVTGTGFTSDSVINWNGGDEPTTYVSATELKTIVKPSTVQAPLPFTLPVYVHNGSVKSDPPTEFTFSEAGGATRSKREEPESRWKPHKKNN